MKKKRVLDELRHAKKQLEEEFQFYLKDGDRWPEDRRSSLKIEGDRGLAGLMPGSNIVWELDRVQAAINGIVEDVSTPKRRRGKKPAPVIQRRNERIRAMRDETTEEIAARLDRQRFNGSFLKDQDPWLKDHWRSKSAASYLKTINSLENARKHFERLIRRAQNQH